MLLLVQVASLGLVQQAVERRAEKNIDLNLRKSEDRLRRELAVTSKSDMPGIRWQ